MACFEISQLQAETGTREQATNVREPAKERLITLIVFTQAQSRMTAPLKLKQKTTASSLCPAKFVANCVLQID